MKMLGGKIITCTGLFLSDAWSAAMDRSAWMALRPVDGEAWRERGR